MMAEVLIGRRGRQSPINAMKDVARESGHSGKWSLVGWMGVLAGFMIFSFYSVVAGWVLYYIAGMGVGDFIAIGSEDAGNVFNGLLADTQTLLIWHSIFVVMVMLVIVGGVKKGLENAVKFLMPALFILLLIMLGYSMQTEGFAKGWDFLFHFDTSELKWSSVLEALGHAFFTLSLGMGAIMAYGSYMPKKTSIGGSVIWIAIMDTLVALIAGLVIFPIVFTNGMDPGAGPGLMFVTLPVAFGQMPGGQIFGFVFFLLVGIAAWTSAISLMEPAAAWLVEKFGWHRIPACTVLGVIVWALGVAALGSFNFMSDVTIAGFNVFDFLDFMTANVMLPLGGLFIAIFAGWFMKRKMAENELAMSSPLLFNAWYIALRFIAPVAVAAIFVINLVEKLK